MKTTPFPVQNYKELYHKRKNQTPSVQITTLPIRLLYKNAITKPLFRTVLIKIDFLNFFSFSKVISNLNFSHKSDLECNFTASVSYCNKLKKGMIGPLRKDQHEIMLPYTRIIST